MAEFGATLLSIGVEMRTAAVTVKLTAGVVVMPLGLTTVIGTGPAPAVTSCASLIEAVSVVPLPEVVSWTAVEPKLTLAPAAKPVPVSEKETGPDPITAVAGFSVDSVGSGASPTVKVSLLDLTPPTVTETSTAPLCCSMLEVTEKLSRLALVQVAANPVEVPQFTVAPEPLPRFEPLMASANGVALNSADDAPKLVSAGAGDPEIAKGSDALLDPSGLLTETSIEAANAPLLWSRAFVSENFSETPLPVVATCVVPQFTFAPVLKFNPVKLIGVVAAEAV